MEYDAFSQGIELGGLRSRSEIRLLLCYLLKSINKGIPKRLLNDAIQQTGLANYFEVNQALVELLEGGNARAEKAEGEEFFYVTSSGREAAELMEAELPLTVREKAVAAALNLLTVYRREKENDIFITKTPQGYEVKIDVFASAEKNRDDMVLSLTLYPSDGLQASMIKKGFLRDPAKLCEAVVSTLLEI